MTSKNICREKRVFILNPISKSPTIEQVLVAGARASMCISFPVLIDFRTRFAYTQRERQLADGSRPGCFISNSPRVPAETYCTM